MKDSCFQSKTTLSLTFTLFLTTIQQKHIVKYHVISVQYEHLFFAAPGFVFVNYKRASANLPTAGRKNTRERARCPERLRTCDPQSARHVCVCVSCVASSRGETCARVVPSFVHCACRARVHGLRRLSPSSARSTARSPRPRAARARARRRSRWRGRRGRPAPRSRCGATRLQSRGAGSPQ